MSGKGPAKTVASPTQQRPAAKSAGGTAAPTQAARPTSQPSSSVRPSATPSPTAGASPARPSSQPRPSAAKSGVAGGSADDPFGEKSDVSQAIPVSRQKTARATEPVTCPMCDSTGYLPPQAFGRDVKCFNPGCLAPVFSAPRRSAAAPQQFKGSSKRERDHGVPLPLVISISSLVAIVALGVSWFIFIRKPVEPPRPTTANDRPSRRGENTDQPATEPTKPVEPEPTEPVVQRTAQQGIDAIIAVSAKEEFNRSKPYCVRLAAYALALEGNQTGSLEQLERLKSFSSSPPHYQIEALTRLAWNALATGDQELAKSWLSKAKESQEFLGTKGRDRLDLSIPLAAALAATGDLAGAESLLKEPDKSTTGQLSAAVQIARSIGSFDINQWIPGSLPGGWENPQRAAVTARLVVEGRNEEALQWVKGGKTPAEKLESLLVYFETGWVMSGTTTPETSLTELPDLWNQLPPEAQALLHARAGQQQAARGNPSGAKKSLDAAGELFTKIPDPPPLRFNSYDDFQKIELPSLENGRVSAFAAAELARLAAVLGETDSATQWFDRSQKILRGVSLSQEQVGAIESKINNLGSAGFQREVKREFFLKSDDEARRRANEILRKVASWKSISNRRFALQFALFTSFHQPELKQKILQEIAHRSSSNDPHERENFEAGALRIQLEGVRGEIGPQGSGFYLGQDLKSIASQLLWNSRQEWITRVQEGKLEEAAGVLRRIENTDDAEYWLTWELNRLVREKRAAEAYQITSQLSNIIHREELIRLISSQAVVTGQQAVAWEAADSPIGVPTVKIAGYTGILEGLQKVPTATPPGPNAATPPDSTTGTASKKETSATSPSEAGTPAKNAP